jgi:hypothetical protein
MHGTVAARTGVCDEIAVAPLGAVFGSPGKIRELVLMRARTGRQSDLSGETVTVTGVQCQGSELGATHRSMDPCAAGRSRRRAHLPMSSFLWGSA